jgi:hypothetical protein
VVIELTPWVARVVAAETTTCNVDALNADPENSVSIVKACANCLKPGSFALDEVCTVSPGAISAVVLTLDADDQFVVQFVPVNCAANGPSRKLCIAEGVIVEAWALAGSNPNVVLNAWSIASWALDGGVVE